MNNPNQSEFGKGLVICLVKFMEHCATLNNMLENMGKGKAVPFMNESEIIKLWANGASDHLYEMYTPDTDEWKDIRAKVKILKDTGLQMGHGFMDSYTYTKASALDLFTLAEDIALDIDHLIGLPDAEREQW